MTSRSCHVVLGALLCVGACDSAKSGGGGGEDKAKVAEKGSDEAPKHAGVWPKDFKCDTIATLAQLTELLGYPVRQVDPIANVPDGVAKPCAYEADVPVPTDLPPDAMPPGPESWSFDFDCRDNMKKTADALFIQYRDINNNRIQAYNAASAAGELVNDAGIVYHAPHEAFDVEVGAKGLDHNDQQILFIDDDAPCYVRVNGPEAARRLTLAKLVAKNLTYVNAPMSLRPLK